MNADFEKFADKVRKELAPMVKDSSIFVSITPANPDLVDIKFAVELGLAIMYDKPIIACVKPGTIIPEKLSKVVDRFVEMDFNDPSQIERLKEAADELAAEKGIE